VTPLPPTTPATVVAATLPTVPGPLAAGAYKTSALRPPLTLRVEAGTGWERNAQFELPDDLEFARTQPPVGTVSVVRPTQVLKGDRLYSTEADIFAPGATDAVSGGNLVLLLRSNPKLTVSQSVAIQRAGINGFQVDVVASAPYPGAACPGAPCVDILRLETNNNWFWLLPTNKNRLYLLNVGGEQVLIVVEAPIDQFDAFVVQADRLINTMRF
jgi:hypothetical protein